MEKGANQYVWMANSCGADDDFSNAGEFGFDSVI